MKEVPQTKLAASAQTPNIEEEIRRRAYELFEGEVEKTARRLKTGLGPKRKSGAVRRMR